MTIPEPLVAGTACCDSNHLDTDSAPPAARQAATGTASIERQCGWCCNRFAVVRRPGRPLIYCKQGCRQRAYERRRGLGVLPPPDRIVMQPGGPLSHLRPQPGAYAYELGRIRYGNDPGKLHAMRPAGITDRSGRRLTLCGLLAWSVRRPFTTMYEESCRTCAGVAAVRKPARPIRLSDDLAALRSLLDVAAVELSRSPRSEHPRLGADQILTNLLLAV